MKTLLLLRHAKSSWNDPSLADHERPLNDRGKRDAPRMGRYLQEHGPRPDAIVCSTANRAQATIEAVLDELEGAAEIPRVNAAALYGAGPDEIVATVRREVSAGAGTVLAVGHNPGFEEAVHTLTGQDETMPTAALAVVEFDIESWQDLTLAPKGRLVQLVRPKDLTE